MIFRTGSILIVGMCETPTLMIVYNYLKRVLSENMKIFIFLTIPNKREGEKNKDKKEIYLHH